MCKRVRVSTKGLKQCKGTVAFFKKRPRQRDDLQGGPPAEKGSIYIERSNRFKRVRVSTKGLKHCRGAWAFFKERHYLLQGGGVYRQRNCLQDKKQSIETGSICQESIHREKSYLQKEGLFRGGRAIHNEVGMSARRVSILREREKHRDYCNNQKFIKK